jgi:hypothetical protein
VDHVLEAIRGHYEVYLDLFIDEHRKCQYKKLSDNPYYEEIKALIDAMNILRKYLGWDSIKLSDEVKWRLEE